MSMPSPAQRRSAWERRGCDQRLVRLRDASAVDLGAVELAPFMSLKRNEGRKETAPPARCFRKFRRDMLLHVHEEAEAPSSALSVAGIIDPGYKKIMPGLVVKPRARIFHGHDWVFRGEILKTFGQPNDGDVVSLKDGRDHLIGSAIYNSHSQIVARRFSRRKQGLDLDFFERRIGQAIEYRLRRKMDPRLCRLVWSESDGLPGIIVDRFGDHLVLQTRTLAMDQLIGSLEQRASRTRPAERASW